MKKLFSFVLISGLLICFAGPTTIMAMKMPKDIVMDDAVGKVKNPVYKPVTFPHQKHVRQGCPVCHHKWTDKKQPPKKCVDAGCHDLIGAKGAQMKAENAAFNAFHNRKEIRSCVGCHLKKKAEGKKFGPIACNKCHLPK